MRGIRTENLKRIDRGDGWDSEMFDLEANPGEDRNVIDAPAYRAQRDALRAESQAFFRRLKAPPIDEWRTTSKQVFPSESAHPRGGR